MLFVGTHHHIRHILARCEDIHTKGDFSIIGGTIWDVNFTAITQSLPLPVPHVTVHDASFHKAWERYRSVQIEAINRFYENGPKIALYVLAEFAVSHAISIVQDERSIPATELDLCRIMTKLINGPRLIPYRLNPHIWLLTNGHETLVRQGR